MVNKYLCPNDWSKLLLFFLIMPEWVPTLVTSAMVPEPITIHPFHPSSIIYNFPLLYSKVNGRYGVNNTTFLIVFHKKTRRQDNPNRGESKNKGIERGKLKVLASESAFSLEYTQGDIQEKGRKSCKDRLDSHY